MGSAKPQINRPKECFPPGPSRHGLRSGPRDALSATFWLAWGVSGWHMKLWSSPVSLAGPRNMHPGERRHGEGRPYRTPGFIFLSTRGVSGGSRSLWGSGCCSQVMLQVGRQPGASSWSPLSTARAKLFLLIHHSL